MEDGIKRLSNEAARVLVLLLLLLLWLLLFRADLVVVRDQVREQLSTMMVVIFLPVVAAAAGADAVAVNALEAAALSLLPPDRSEMSLGGPVADANDIFSSSNSTGPEDVRQTKTKLSVDKESIVSIILFAD